SLAVPYTTLFRSAEDWPGRTRYTTAFGQGYSVNALQMTSAVGTFANQGVRVDPRVVAGTREDDGSVRPLGEPASTRVVSAETAETVAERSEEHTSELQSRFD